MTLDAPIRRSIVPAVGNPMEREIATFGPVHLEVTDLGRSIAFWRDIIGLVLKTSDTESADLGTADETLVTLYAGARVPFLGGHSGIYHLAIHPQTKAGFAGILWRLIRAQWRISPTDHVMSKAIYLLDPDGITVEITLETPERLRELLVDEEWVKAVAVDGSLHSGRDRFDVEEVLAALSGEPAGDTVPEGTRIGHMHLYVGNLLAAYQFYRSLGFQQAVWAPHLGVGDLGAGGAFNHRIAVNTFQGVNVPQSPEGSARMRHFTMRFDTPERLDTVLDQLGPQVAAKGGEFFVKDPAGNTVLLQA